MASVYFEYLPPSHNTHTKGILLLCACVLGGSLGALAFVLLCTFLFPLNYLFAFLVLLLAFTVYWMAVPYTDVEVEYCVAQDELRIDKILAKRTRKDYLRIDTVNIQRIVPLAQASLPKEGVKDCTGGNETDLFAVFYRENEQASEDSVLLLHLPSHIEKQLYLACPRAQRR